MGTARCQAPNVSSDKDIQRSRMYALHGRLKRWIIEDCLGFRRPLLQFHQRWVVGLVCLH